MIRFNDFLARIWLNFEYRAWMVEAYLAERRGDKLEATDCYLRANRAIRELELISTLGPRAPERI